MKSLSMLRIAWLLAPVSAASLAAGAQTFSMVEGPSSCPVSLHAGHPAGLHATEKQARQWDDPTESAAPSFRLEITAGNPAREDIVSLRITAHGLRAGAPFPEELNRVAIEPDFEQTVMIAMDVKGASQGTREILLQQFRSVSSVDLDSVTYADGSTWHASANGKCSVRFDPLKLVNADTP